MSKNRRTMIILLIVVLTVSLCMMIRQVLAYQQGRVLYGRATELAQTEILPPTEKISVPYVVPESSEISETPEVPADLIAQSLAQTDLEALQEVNNEVLGWLLLPDTDLSYPVVQGTDNQYYLYHTWDKTESVVGAIFLECQNSPNMDGFSTILYGHRMRDGSMFGILKRYAEQDFWKQHPSIYLLAKSRVLRYDIYAAYEVSIQGTTYRLRFDDANDRQEYIDFGLNNSVIHTNVIPTGEDKVITLSTCTGNGHSHRWVVQAVLSAQFKIEP